MTRPITKLFEVQIPNPFWPTMVLGFLWYTSAVLVISSRDVQRFASFIYWEAVLRFFAVVNLIVYGFSYVGRLPTVHFAITDFAWGCLHDRAAASHSALTHLTVAGAKLRRWRCRQARQTPMFLRMTKRTDSVEQPESALCIDLAFGRLRCYHVARLPGLTDHRQRV